MVKNLQAKITQLQREKERLTKELQLIKFKIEGQEYSTVQFDTLYADYLQNLQRLNVYLKESESATGDLEKLREIAKIIDKTAPLLLHLITLADGIKSRQDIAMELQGLHCGEEGNPEGFKRVEWKKKASDLIEYSLNEE